MTKSVRPIYAARAAGSTSNNDLLTRTGDVNSGRAYLISEVWRATRAAFATARVYALGTRTLWITRCDADTPC